MDALVAFYGSHGLPLTLSALAGIILLGVMKYCNLFRKIQGEDVRHIVYISVAAIFSVILAGVYMYMADTFDLENLTLFSTNVFVLNQTFYNIFKATTLQGLLKKFLKKLNILSE